MRASQDMKLTRRFLVQALLSGLAAPALAKAPLVSERPPQGRGPVLPPAAGSLVRKADLKGTVTFAVADARTGKILESQNPQVGIAPASVTKAITALYALDVLGADHRFETQVVATGGVEDGVVRGDLVLVGGCDPMMDTRALAELAAQLKAAGVREVKGDFRVFEGPIASVRTIDPEQPDHVGYSPAVSGIALNFNRVHFEWKRASGKYSVTMDARAGRFRPEVDIARMQVVQRRAPIYTYADQEGRDRWTVASGALGNGGARWLPVRRPGLYAGEVFATLARSHGIVLKTPKLSTDRTQGQVLARLESDPLSEILRAMLKYSNNLIAEMVGQAATYARVGKVSGLAASAAEMNRWAQDVLGMQSPAFVDHSGLGGASRVSAEDMVRGLGALGHASLLRPLLKPVKLLDAQGRTINDHPVQAEAKTGTLNFVSGLAGYITTPERRDLIFAVFAADEATRATLGRDQRERPPGGRSYSARARRLQRQLIMRWGAAFSQVEG
ncbi:MAG: D-alanyl-D-alanine carboxypeptidase/D-alanyl-D-alanine-endopeptidase [Pseudomonadota bacterium]